MGRDQNLAILIAFSCNFHSTKHDLYCPKPKRVSEPVTKRSKKRQRERETERERERESKRRYTNTHEIRLNPISYILKFLITTGGNYHALSRIPCLPREKLVKRSWRWRKIRQNDQLGRILYQWRKIKTTTTTARYKEKSMRRREKQERK